MKTKFSVSAQKFVIIPASLPPKNSPSPPFDYAQGMLFQRGVAEIIPPLKKGDQGGFKSESTAAIVWSF
jgi:hypothetical protein